MNTLKHAFFFLLLLIFTSCATIFVPGKQTITIKTGSEDSEIYVSNVKFGDGPVATNKINRGQVQEVVIKYGDDYYQKNELLIPKSSRVPGYYIGQALNIPFCLAFYGFLAIKADNYCGKTHPYENEYVFDEPPLKLPIKTDDLKYVYLSNIRLDIDDYDKDIVTHIGKKLDDDDENLKLSMNSAEAASKKQELKNLKKEEKKKRKGKNKEYLVEEQKDLRYSDVIFSDDLLNVLYEGGFMDTVNNIFTDNNNSLIIEGKIDRINIFKIDPVKSNANTKYICKIKTDLTWYIKNTYGEILDSIYDVAESDKFKYSLEYNYQTGQYDNDNIIKTIGNSISNSFYNLLQSEVFTKHSKVITDFDPGLDPTKLNLPTDIVEQKRDAAEASVIVKTENAHGSGFAITNDGYIITNYHVISSHLNSKNNNKVTIIDSDGNEMLGEIVKFNKFQDVALIKVDHKFSKAFLCKDEKSFNKMDDVYTIGAPKSVALGQSISIGLISNERKINNNYLIQLNMSINSGNSGGPIFDSSGTLHGVVVSKLVGRNTEGVSFAVPSYLLAEYLNIVF